MNEISDKILLLLYCLLSLYLVPQSPWFVAGFFSAIAVSAFCYAAEAPFWRRLTVCIYLTAVFFQPEFSLFLPLIFYDCQDIWTMIPGILLIIRQTVFQKDWQLLAFLGLGCILAFFFRQKTNQHGQLQQRFLKCRDDDTEMQLLLQEKNQSLLEKQDAEIYAATLRERNRIAREIHDNVGHMLTRSILMVGALQAVNKSSELAPSLEQLNTTLNSAMTSIRESVHNLHESSLDLEETLGSLVTNFTFCPVELDYQISPHIPMDVKYCFAAVTREALVNVARHSNASLTHITVREHPGFYQLIIHDNGTPAPSADVLSQNLLWGTGQRQGIGLTNMQTRVHALKGNLRIQTDSGFGIYIMIPKESEATL